MIEDGRLDAFVANRYASYNEGIGKKIADRATSLAELEQYALNMGEVSTNGSGRQEYLEHIVNGMLFR
jgi:xylose isomerase